MEYLNNIPRSALDFKGYGELKAQATRNEKMATKEVAKQFEAMFVQMMLKSMRAAVPRNEENRSKTMETFEQMYDREIAVAMSRKGGLGLANMLEKHLDKVNSSSQEILENRFQLNKKIPLNKQERLFKLKTNETEKGLPLDKVGIGNRLKFSPIKNNLTVQEVGSQEKKNPYQSNSSIINKKTNIDE